MNGDLVGKVAHCRQTGHIGYVVGFLDKPCYIIEATDGTRYTLNQSQMHEVPSYDEVDYWKSRAFVAEDKLKRAEA